jgi:hypothetical protein
MESLTVWTLTAMVAAWLSIGKMVGITPKDVAKAIAVASTEKPLPFENEADRRTASFMTAVGVFESGFNNQAKGDCKDKPPGWPGCGKEDDSKPTSFCFLQVHFIDGVTRVKGYTPEELMADPLACARAGREIMRDSIEANKKERDRLRDLGRVDEWINEPLKTYAGTSSPARKRFDLAVKLFKEVPFSIRCD